VRKLLLIILIVIILLLIPACHVDREVEVFATDEMMQARDFSKTCYRAGGRVGVVNLYENGVKITCHINQGVVK
jgi:hypothetical protein